MHHLNGSPVPASDLRGQALPENRHVLTIGRANIRRKVSWSTVFPPLRSKQEQLGKLACGKPRESAAIVNPPECQASVTIQAVPAQMGDIDPCAAHGLHGIPEDRFHMSDFDEHDRFATSELTGSGD